MRALITFCLSVSSSLVHAGGRAPRAHDFAEVVSGRWSGLADEPRAVIERARADALAFENFRQKNSSAFRDACANDPKSNRFCDLVTAPEVEKNSNPVPVETRRKFFDVLTRLDDPKTRGDACRRVGADLAALVADEGAGILHSRARYWAWACAALEGDRAEADRWREELWQHHPFSDLTYRAMSADRDGRWTEALTAPATPWAVEARAGGDEEFDDVLRGVEALVELGKDGAAALVLKRHQARVDEQRPELRLYVGALAARVARTIPHVQPVFRTLEPLALEHREYLRRPILEILYPRPEAYFEELRRARGALDAGLFAGIVHQESAMYPRARSRVAFGLTQLVPSTATEVDGYAGVVRGPVTGEMLFDPAVSLPLGAAYLAKLLDKFGGDEALALAAYHSGDDRLQKWIAKTYKFVDPEVRAHALYLDLDGATSTAVYVLGVFSRANFYRELYGPELDAR